MKHPTLDYVISQIDGMGDSVLNFLIKILIVGDKVSVKDVQAAIELEKFLNERHGDEP